MNVFGNSSSSQSDSQIDTSAFVKKTYLKTNYLEANLEEDVDMKNQYYIKNLLPSAVNLDDAISKKFAKFKLFKNY